MSFLPTKLAITASLLAAVPFFFSGYDVTTVTTGQNLIPVEALEEDVDRYDCFHKVYVLVGAFVGGLSMNYAGRKFHFIFGSALYGTGGMVAAFCGPRFEVFKWGRAFMGLGIGFGVVAGPIYLAEVSPAGFRGSLGCLPQVLWAVGRLAGYGLGHAFSQIEQQHHHHLGWELLMSIPASLALALAFINLRWLPESPCHLANRGRLGTAKQLLGPGKLGAAINEVENRAHQLKLVAGIPEWINDDYKNYTKPKGGGIRGMWPQFFNSLPTLLTVTALHVLHRLSGEHAVMTYVQPILGYNGFGSHDRYLIALVALAGTRLFSSLVPLILVDRLGRKKLMAASAVATALAVGTLGVTNMMMMNDDEDDDVATRGFEFDKWCALGMELGIGIGIGAIPWLYGPEAFKLPSRALGVGSAVVAGDLMLSVLDTRGLSFYGKSEEKLAGALLMSSGLMVVVLVISCTVMKEMRRQVLMDAEEEEEEEEESQGDLQLSV